MWSKKNLFFFRSKVFYCTLFCLLLLSNLSFASYTKSFWPMWFANNPLSTEVISHKEWQAFLDKRVLTNNEGINVVDYAHVSTEEKNLLKQYLQRLSEINIDNYNRKEQLAYWINLYNALTVDIVTKYYPVSSVQEINISPGLFSIGPWGANLIKVTNTSLSLDDINNRIIRPIWSDPRTHYALNNASIGAPDLSKQVYIGSKIDNQLNQAASKYINSLRGVQVIEGKLIVSKIYEWYAEDFGGSVNDTIDHIKHFAKKNLLDQLKHINTIDSYVYNWHLNAYISSDL